MYIKTKQKCPMPVTGKEWTENNCSACKWWRSDHCLFEGMMKREANMFFAIEKDIAKCQKKKAEAESLIRIHEKDIQQCEEFYSRNAEMRLKVAERLKQNKRR